MAAVFKGTREELIAKVQEVIDALAGKGPDVAGIGKSVLIAMGVAALGDIMDAFVVKSRGGTDAMGIKWPPLDPKTVAARRVGPRDTRNSAAIKEREKIRKREFKKALKRYQMSLPPEEARRRAAMVAGIRATRLTGQTKVETLGGRNVEMLRDTGILANSLSPGVMTGDGAAMSYSKPSGEGGDQQLFDLLPGAVIVGSNLPYAGRHQNGDPPANLPARPFLPRDESDIPEEWWENWLEAGAITLEAGLEYYLST
jgi:hypothetical protein